MRASCSLAPLEVLQAEYERAEARDAADWRRRVAVWDALDAAAESAAATPPPDSDEPTALVTQLVDPLVVAPAAPPRGPGALLLAA